MKWLHGKCHIDLTDEANDQKMLYKQEDEYDGGDYGGYSDYGEGLYDANKLKKTDPTPQIIECYSCHYSYISHHIQGMPNCADPFREAGIPTVPCDGLCATTKIIMSEHGYMLSRSCLVNCKNISDPVSSVECCIGSKCNGRNFVLSIYQSYNMALISLPIVFTLLMPD